MEKSQKNMQNKKGFALSLSKGFTIIELIVVIAIIAILAAIVMVNVTQYIKKSRYAAMEAEMEQIRTIATSYFADSGTYSGMCDEGSECFKTSATLEQNGGSIVGSQIDVNFYCVYAYLGTGMHITPPAYTNDYWCVDSTGYSGPIPHGCGSIGACLPAS